MNSDAATPASDAFVKKSLVCFIQQETSEDAADMIDEILLAYVVGILESDIAEEGFDVLEFKEMLSAYIPSFDSISDTKISSWVGLLSGKVGKHTEKKRTESLLISPVISPESKTSNKSTPRSRNTSQSEEDIGKPNRIAVCDESELCDGTTFRTLCEMFPAACALEVRRCLMVAGGDTEAAAQLLLQRDAAAETLLSGPAHGSANPRRDTSSLPLGDKELREQILTRYGYIDQDEDEKEHRPVAPKTKRNAQRTPKLGAHVCTSRRSMIQCPLKFQNVHRTEPLTVLSVPITRDFVEDK
ncbi:CUE domain-containing protein 2-B isoform X1 [Dermacentor variabilis]|uniref:CUE domain-containing protein 2-B isoform X1 n=1 Tax=Dermacentor variabilis TaxID=34621 RepID=UPI003F5B3D81